MRPIQLVQRIKCGGASHLPRYFFFPYLTRLCYLPWSSSFQYGWLPKAFSRCLYSSGTPVPMPVLLFSSVFLFIFTWIFNHHWVFNHSWVGPIVQKCARITCPHNNLLSYMNVLIMIGMTNPQGGSSNLLWFSIVWSIFVGCYLMRALIKH